MKRKQDELSSLAVKSLVCEEADEHVGLPILWRGQEVGEVGPIEPLPEHVRQEPYSLPQGFQWVTLNSSDAEEVVYFMRKTQPTLGFSLALFYYTTTHPHTKSEWQFGIRSSNGKLVGVVLAYPVCMSIGGILVMCVRPRMSFHFKYHNKRILYMAHKELQRRINLSNISQFIFLSMAGIFKPVTTHTLWTFQFTNSTSYQLPNSPRTPGWRRMTSEDVPSVLAFVNKYLSQFEIRQVFTSEEEFSHHFLCPALPNYVITYVVENETNNITDLVRCVLEFGDDGKVVTCINPVISTLTPVKQLISDVMVCARDNGTDSLVVGQLNIKSEILLSLSFQPITSLVCYFYNYKYHEVSEANYFAI
ncbi:glycylpeptide N-tetradecanoyltransferase 2-like [Dysidea avara]|uniref:glycylpeptide N-tetradecanoyltransferase 2-like n=1 Tax=Dysidea avara TaxID=196820 RepID=UPI0033209B01